MKKKEYKQIMEELNEKSFAHEFPSITEELEQDGIQVVALEDVYNTLNNHIGKRRKKESGGAK